MLSKPACQAVICQHLPDLLQCTAIAMCSSPALLSGDLGARQQARASLDGHMQLTSVSLDAQHHPKTQLAPIGPHDWHAHLQHGWRVRATIGSCNWLLDPLQTISGTQLHAREKERCLWTMALQAAGSSHR